MSGTLGWFKCVLILFYYSIITLSYAGVSSLNNSCKHLFYHLIHIWCCSRSRVPYSEAHHYPESSFLVSPKESCSRLSKPYRPRLRLILDKSKYERTLSSSSFFVMCSKALNAHHLPEQGQGQLSDPSQHHRYSRFPFRHPLCHRQRRHTCFWL